MSDRPRLLLAAGCLVCLLTVASALPAADPRIGSSGAGEPLLDSSETDQQESPDEPEQQETPELNITGAWVPTEEVTVNLTERVAGTPTVLFGQPNDSGELDPAAADVERGVVGSTFEVPFEETVTVAVPEAGIRETFDVATDATLDVEQRIPARETMINVSIGSTDIPGVAVSLDGDRVGTTDDDGTVVAELPPAAGPVEITAQREVVTAARTVEVAEPTISIDRPAVLIFPGSEITVSVTAGGEPVRDATVTVGDETYETDADGTVSTQLPLEDEATVTATVGEEQASVTFGSLYLRLASVVVFVPGLILGLLWSYVLVVKRADREPFQRPVGAHAAEGAFVVLADLLAALIDALRALLAALASLRLSAPRLGSAGLPSFTLPGLGSDSSWSGFDGLFGSAGSNGSSLRSRLSAALGGDTRTGSPDADGPGQRPAEDGEDAVEHSDPDPDDPRRSIRESWYALVARLDVSDPERRTPGQVARRAIAAGLPAGAVRRLLGAFRDVEYGGQSATSEEAAAAEQTAAALAAQVDEEDEDE